MSYETTGGMKSEAQKGLDWRSEFGRGGTEVGIARARDIVNGRNLSESTVKRMFSFFSRHEVDKQAEGFRPGEDGYPSNGRIAWALWGGDAGFSWSKKIMESLDDNREQPDELEVGDFVSEEMSMDGEEMSMDGEEMSMDMEDDRLAEIEIVHRTFGMTTDDIINEGTREVQIVMSTENPVERGYGMEVLDHSKESVDMSWIATGRAPLLLDHDMSQQIGKITSVELDEAERKVRALVVFGRGPLAEEIFQDVKDGIRQNISVGYAINKMEREGTDTYRVKSWRPMEASIVSIPADSQSRVGRSAEAPPKPVIVSSTAEEKPMSEEINVEAVKAEARQAAMKDASAILELAAKHNRSDLGRSAVGEGRSLAEFRGILLEQIGEKPLESHEIGMNKREIKRFSLIRAIRALANPSDRRAQQEAAFEFEASRAASEMYGVTAQGLMIPADVLRSWAKRDLSAGVDTSLIPEDFRAGDFIDVLRNSSSVMQAGARMLQGLSGNVAIPKKATAAAGGWIATEGGASAESEATFGQVTMTPKTVGAFTDVTRQMMIQASPDIEALIRDDLTQAIALSIDLGALAGTGSSGQPTGIRATSGINTQAFAATDPTFAELVAMETAVAEDNALVGNLAYIMRATQYGALKTTEKATNTAQFVVEPGGTVNGYRTIVSNQVVAGDVYFGNYADLLIGMYGGLDLLVDPYTASSTGTVRVVALQSVDVAVRNAVSFCLGDA